MTESQEVTNERELMIYAYGHRDDSIGRMLSRVPIGDARVIMARHREGERRKAHGLPNELPTGFGRDAATVPFSLETSGREAAAEPRASSPAALPTLAECTAKLRAAAAGDGSKARAARRALIELHPEEMTELEIRSKSAALGRRIAALEARRASSPTSTSPASTPRAIACADLDLRMGLVETSASVQRRGHTLVCGHARPEPRAAASDDDALLRARELERARALTARSSERTEQQRHLDARMGTGFAVGVQREGNVMRFGVLPEAE